MKTQKALSCHCKSFKLSTRWSSDRWKNAFYFAPSSFQNYVFSLHKNPFLFKYRKKKKSKFAICCKKKKIARLFFSSHLMKSLQKWLKLEISNWIGAKNGVLYYSYTHTRTRNSCSLTHTLFLSLLTFSLSLSFSHPLFLPLSLSQKIMRTLLSMIHFWKKKKRSKKWHVCMLRNTKKSSKRSNGFCLFADVI